ncbi:MAG TPA: DUF2784 domain-containing protein [Noviherbaspirillum sp.]|jgi:hypothetical protein|uniref:DUF2784 domain-containing protein n=1 Tax=Noviherbaspirillum sp. TaxID=1926288 RepID=UPI002DDDAD80|nr:DUF2784 domain-containing protein [Noviherbaspirillum sp.]HEV2609359.1 DUF2784 domain-containing protein [Noviherbaspirillum sp.]
MLYRFLADIVLITHFAFAVFTLLGGLLLLRYPRLMPLHLAALCWAVIVQWANLICPLTPLENYLRVLGDQDGYAAGFVEHFVLKVMYPDDLTVELRYLIGMILVAVNAAVYVLFIWRRRAAPGRSA